MKAKADQADNRATLKRLEAERGAMAFVPATAEAVEAAREAVKAAERTRIAECESRGRLCRSREADEQTARVALSTTLVNRAATAAGLDRQIAGLRKSLARAPAVKEGNSLGGDAPRPHPAPVSGHSSHGPARARLGHRRAANNRATLALPELLKRNPQAKGKEEPEPIAEAKPLTMPKPTMADGTAIARFMLACLPRAKGQEVEARTIYARFSRWCDAQVPPLAPLAPSDFAAAFKAWCERGNIRVRRDGGKIYCQDVRLVA